MIAVQVQIACLAYLAWTPSHLYAPVAQLDRAAAFEAAGRRFESSRARLIALSYSYKRL